ncbi:MAG: hypothetical protein KAS87_01525 [Candidatus Omnitrophica bacterium]|nr:hypothetical protein [Candidatus Omnitrophota bacterium]
MFKKVLSWVIVCIFLFSFSPSYAQISDEEYSAQMKALKVKLAQAKEEYVQAKRASRKAAMESFLSFGKTKEEKETRKKVLEEAKKKEAQLRETYKKAKEVIKSRERKLKTARKEAKKAIGKTKRETEKTQRSLEKGVKKSLGKSKGKK